MDDARLYDAACGRHGLVEQEQAFRLLWEHLFRIAYLMLRHKPDPDMLAADCAQEALIKIDRNLARCQKPESFRAWAARIVRNNVLDLLRRTHLEDPLPAHIPVPPPEVRLDLRALLEWALHEAGLSERSRRVVIGRFLDEQTDEALAAEESRLSGETIRPSHIQVTRSKNLAKLRGNDDLLNLLRDLR